MNDDIINGLYVELDCIIDTRISLLFDIDKNNIELIVKENKYHERFLDQFGYIPVKLFRQIYNMRNINVLDNPINTEIPKMIAEYCLEANITEKTYGVDKPINVYVNTYPYNLTEENKELFIMGLCNSIYTNINVILMFEPLDKISVSFLKDNIGLAIMYDGLLWVENKISNEELVKVSLPDTTLITPTLVHRNILIAKKDMKTFFEDVEKSVNMLINLVYVPTKLFCFNEK